MDILGENYIVFYSLSTGWVYVQLLKKLVNGKPPLNVLLLATLTLPRDFKKVISLIILWVMFLTKIKTRRENHPF